MKQMWSDERWQRVRMDEMNGRNVFLIMTRISFIILPAKMMRCLRVHMQLMVKISLSTVEKTILNVLFSTAGNGIKPRKIIRYSIIMFSHINKYTTA